jgi:hypothetical protein
MKIFVDNKGIWQIVEKQKRMLITTDKGFANYRDEPHHGIIIVRLRQPNRKKIHFCVLQTFIAYKESEWKGLMVIVRDIQIGEFKGTGQNATKIRLNSKHEIRNSKQIQITKI